MSQKIAALTGASAELSRNMEPAAKPRTVAHLHG